MANLFDDKTKTFLFTFFKNQANAQGDINKAVSDGNTLYNTLTNKYTTASDIPNNELTPILNQLNQLISIKNKYHNLVNNGIKQLSTLIKIIDVISAIIKVSQIIIQILTALPMPATYLTAGIIVKFGDIVQKTDRKIESLGDTIVKTRPFLSILLSILNTIKTQIDVLDGIIGLIQKFLLTKSSAFSKTFLNSLTDTVDIQQQLTGLGNLVGNSNVIGFYNSFRFELREENNTQFQVQGIKRKYAVAINTRGQEILKSDLSFASQPQVLIDTLKFIIDRDHLIA